MELTDKKGNNTGEIAFILQASGGRFQQQSGASNTSSTRGTGTGTGAGTGAGLGAGTGAGLAAAGSGNIRYITVALQQLVSLQAHV